MASLVYGQAWAQNQKEQRCQSEQGEKRAKQLSRPDDDVEPAARPVIKCVNFVYVN